MKKHLVRAGMSALLLFVLFTFVTDVEDVWSSLKRLKPYYLLAALLTVGLDRFLMTYKWLLLLRAINHGLPLLRGLMIYCSSTLVGTVLPVTIGGDVVRTVLATRAGIGGEHVVASIVVERMLGFLSVLMLATFSLGALRYTGFVSPSHDLLTSMTLLALCGGALLSAAAFNEDLTNRVLQWLPQRFRHSRVWAAFGRTLAAYRELGAARSVLGQFTLLTFVEQLLPVATMWLLLKGLGSETNLFLLICALSVSLVVGRLPISIDGLGVFETILAGLMVLAGVPPAHSVAAALAGRGLQLIVCLPWGLTYLCRYGIRHREPCTLGVRDRSLSS